MGWAAYKVTKSNGETMPLIFPILPEKYILQPIERSISELLDLGYPVETTVFTLGKWVQLFKDFGFGNTIVCDDVDNETLTLDNGARIEYSKQSNGTVSFNYYNSDGTRFVGWRAPQQSVSAATYLDPRGVTPPFIIQKSDGTITGGLSERIIEISGQECTIGDGPSPYYYPRFQPATNPSYNYSFFEGATPIIESSDPYNPGGETEPGGGEGDFDNTGDDVPIPNVPTLSAVDAKFITLFTPTLAEMQSLASYMWSDVFDIATWKKLFADPMQAILGLSIVPVTVPSSSGRPVTVGNIPTDVSMRVADSQYVTLDCGTLNVNEFWGAYLDYDPYTKAEIYLPYIGTHALSTDDIMGKAVQVVYHIDILSGACCAYIKCGGSVLYSFIGQCAASVPITGDNWTNVINGALSIAGAIGSMVATGGMTAPMAAGQIASTAVNAMKPSIQKSGGMSGTGGMLGVQTPYLILTRPRQALPLDQSTFTGYPSFITENLADLTGYTEVESIHLENVPATESELSEIETLLKSGVIF